MGQTKLVSFEVNDVVSILKVLGIKTKEKGETTHLLEDNGEEKLCAVCKKELTIETVGNIAKGSHLVFCDNPICFITYLETIK